MDAKGRHHFYPGDLVTRLDGVLGVVISRTMLYADVAWDDGRTEEIEQGDRSVYNEGNHGGFTGDIAESHFLWSTAGPRPEPREEQGGEERLAA